MKPLPNTATGRIDTTITLVAVRRGDSTTTVAAAKRYIFDKFDDERPRLLAMWSTHTRDKSGNPVFAVEWESGLE